MVVVVTMAAGPPRGEKVEQHVHEVAVEEEVARVRPRRHVRQHRRHLGNGLTSSRNRKEKKILWMVLIVPRQLWVVGDLVLDVDRGLDGVGEEGQQHWDRLRLRRWLGPGQAIPYHTIP